MRMVELRAILPAASVSPLTSVVQTVRLQVVRAAFETRLLTGFQPVIASNHRQQLHSNFFNTAFQKAL